MNRFQLYLLFHFLIQGWGLNVWAAEKPNILFLFSDDQCWEAMGKWQEEVKTPHLDRLAEAGTVFQVAYNQGSWSGAVCVASRTMLNTGRSLWAARQIQNDLAVEVEKKRFWGQLMEEAGYRTYFSGKWHVKADAAAVFQRTLNIRPGMPKQTKAGYGRPKGGAAYNNGWKPWDMNQGGFWEGGTHWSEVLTEDGKTFLKEASVSEDPFFMVLAFNAPHDPRQAPREFVERYPVETISVPGNFLPEYPFNQDMGAGRRLRDERLAPFPRTPFAVQVHRQEYFALITHMDEQIGQLLDALEASGQKDNTIIFFTSDHGLAVGQHGLMGKQSMFEHSMRAPLMVSGPGIPENKVLSTPVYLQDLMPTALELAGSEVPEYVDFKSLLPLIRGERQTQYDSIYGAYKNQQRMLRFGDYKLILYPSISKSLLFDLKEDPLETRDLSEKPEMSPILQRCWEALQKWQKEIGDPLELDPSTFTSPAS